MMWDWICCKNCLIFFLIHDTISKLRKENDRKMVLWRMGALSNI